METINQSDMGDENDLRVLFKNLNFFPSSEGLKEADTSYALDLGRLVLDDNSSHENNDNDGNSNSMEDEIAQKEEVIRKEQAIQRLANSLRHELKLGSTTATDEMYKEMAHAMLKCRIKDGIAMTQAKTATASTETSEKDTYNIQKIQNVKSESHEEAYMTQAVTEDTIPEGNKIHDRHVSPSYAKFEMQNHSESASTESTIPAESLTFSDNRKTVGLQSELTENENSSIPDGKKNEVSTSKTSNSKEQVEKMNPLHEKLSTPNEQRDINSDEEFDDLDTSDDSLFNTPHLVHVKPSIQAGIREFNKEDELLKDNSNSESQDDVIVIDDDDDNDGDVNKDETNNDFSNLKKDKAVDEVIVIDDDIDEDEFVFMSKSNSNEMKQKKSNVDPEPKPQPELGKASGCHLPKTCTKPGKYRRKTSTNEVTENQDYDQHQSDMNPSVNGSAFTSSFEAPPNFLDESVPVFRVDLSNEDKFRRRTRLLDRKGIISRKGGHKQQTTSNSTPLNPFAVFEARTSNEASSSREKQPTADLNHNPTLSQSLNTDIPKSDNKPVVVTHSGSSTTMFHGKMNEAAAFQKRNGVSFEKDNGSNTSNTFGSQLKENGHKSNEFQNTTTPFNSFTFNIGKHSSLKTKKNGVGVRRKGSRIAKRNRNLFFNAEAKKHTLDARSADMPTFDGGPPPISTPRNKKKTDSSTGTLKFAQQNLNSSVPSPSHDPTPEKSKTPLPKVNKDFSGLTHRISYLRSEGREHYTSQNYTASIHSYTAAIAALNSNINTSSVETFAILHGNRAAALMMLGAYSTAAIDSETALNYVDDIKFESNASVQDLLPESGIVLRSKLTCRLGRAYLKCGDMKRADRAFDLSIERSESALRYSRHLPSDLNVKAIGIIKQTLADAKLAKNDVKRFLETMKAADATEQNTPHSLYDKYLSQRLIHINNALSISPGCKLLHERKVLYLKAMGKWRDLSFHCEKLACEMVKLDNIFIGDLKGFREDEWLFDVGPARFLKPDKYQKTDDLYVPLEINEVVEAVVRLPKSVLPHYLRSLRLEERYAEASKACTSLEVYIASELSKSLNVDYDRGKFLWLRTERDKLRRTITAKEKGDNFFRQGLYDRAAGRYASCLTIDDEGESPTFSEKVGGKLHAVLHCNRAACFMALRKFDEAIRECSAALDIESRYMKAILRRARCQARRGKYQEAMNDFKSWITLVEDAHKTKAVSMEPCPFDKASDVTIGEKDKVKKELEDVKQAMRDALRRSQADKARAERERIFRENYNKSSSRGRDGRYKDSNKWDNGSGRGFENGKGSSYAYEEKHYYRQNSASGGRAYENGARNSKKEKHWNGTNSKDRSKKENSSENYQSKDVGSPGSDMSKCHYDVLQVTRSSNNADIKKAYRKMALKYHPDKNNQDPTAADIFRRVKLAYEVLSDVNSRKAYDFERRFKFNY